MPTNITAISNEGYSITPVYLFMPTSSPVRKVSLTKSVVGTTIDANDCPGEGTNEGTYGAHGNRHHP